ncbi:MULTISPECIES: diadenylate cyclase CdaA [Aerococcus]|uniref:Diadenylate cyclase n=1 Tax=Aerococcus sanguinicola TaxID=119206 RepID=A0A5N1GEH9_9LACT|nr:MULTISPECIES: diadenylate cyclase CdaA [Aerococcus]KAA9299283.1 TIGR00159 family protein [Aerococcus sanguinicola]MDK6370091.1 diadenylate cyclase CdaA [Aerococcus sp. UMB9870]MDK6680695.1 diadenylate cyclase CdaA [Aerococcus sp. UMB8608]MDK6687489.1 diadenylate cyclase CdaA [Aerococcus sp. UMB8623]MDK6940645.1 diadenylate cyclase CdaA [Aerococcus sp. UMB8487]
MSFDWSSIFTLQHLFNLIDILIVWFLFYQLLKVIRHTKAINILNGIFVFIVIKILSSVFRLETIDWIMNSIIQWSVVGVLIIFQPEIRRGLEHLGQRLFAAKRQQMYTNPMEEMVEEIIDASKYMAKRRIGALISIEQEQSLTEFAKTGISLNAAVSSQLLINIFIPNTPLHDGAVIIQDGEISSAASFLPLSENPDIPKELGTRHRAAVGLSEQTDAITVVVSEETGGISLTYRGRIIRDLSEDELRQSLKDHFIVAEEQSESNILSRLFAKEEKESEAHDDE